MKNRIVQELNEFLEGNYMAIHAYEDFIEHLEDSEAKQVLQDIQQGHKQHAAKIAERIQHLDGVPVDDVGLKGKMVEFMKNMKGTAHGKTEILKDALVGEKRGIDVSKQLLKNDLDPESLNLVKEILSHDEKHVDQLNQLL
ncbi:ferritin-like domain-containing protein [Lederbergia sp. NSJ-179]|uniref:DUF2383 domain-containing protein n=1 Tax=Lederbergia sp. NSJ-179 TaxID=2931402 RepID=UPI001FD41D8D|nr:DUF2383 domain-containing protein [Lederbergia sp. NSJ-179]MCJ7841342.1 ferritin-like domain-containing protein [Lederbergia sp. NSJ-179]